MDQGFVSASRVDDARRAVEVAQAQVESARAQTQAIADSGTDVVQAQAQLELSRAATSVARAKLAQTLVTAPADAKVLSRQVEPGQIVQPGKALFSLALAGPTQLVAPVDERFLDQLQVGQSAAVVADAFPGQPFAAQVLTIAPAIDAQRGAVEVKLALDRQPPSFLREDMTLSVDVETGRRERTLVVPLSALRTQPAPRIGHGAGGQRRPHPGASGAPGPAHARRGRGAGRPGRGRSRAVARQSRIRRKRAGRRSCRGGRAWARRRRARPKIRALRSATPSGAEGRPAMPLWLGFERRVALRFLREGRMQALLIIVGVAAGVAVIAFISALINGLQSNTLTKTLGAQAHITLHSPDDVVLPARPAASQATVMSDTQPREQRLRSLINWQALVPLLEARDDITAVSPMVSGSGLALRGEATQAIALMGVDLDRYDRIVSLRSKVVSGQARLAPGEAVIGRELASDLGVRVGDRLTLQTGSVSDSVRVTALVDLGVRDLNRRTVIVPLRTAQSLLGLPGGATSLDLTVKDVWTADALAAELRRQLPYKIEAWQEVNAQLVAALNAQSVSTTLIRGVVLVVVVLGIASVLVVSVVQKSREIGILRAMGATRGQILRVFLVQGAVVGALGSLLGVALATVMIWLFTHFVRGSDGLPLFVISLPLATAVRVALLATVCGVLAAIAPARRAARMDPAQAIRI